MEAEHSDHEPRDLFIWTRRWRLKRTNSPRLSGTGFKSADCRRAGHILSAGQHQAPAPNDSCEIHAAVQKTIL